jgi:hypothetical protein
VTALSRENLLEWAKRRVEQEPTYTERRWDAGQSDYVEETKPNTQVRELTTILMASFVRSIGECKQSELVELLADWAQNGCRGFGDYTVDEALAEIVHELVDPDNSIYEFGSLEDLLNEFDLPH